MSADEFNHFVRMAGTDLAGEWFVGYALTNIKGVGSRLSHLILNKAEIPLDVRIGFLTEEEIKRIMKILEDPTKFDLPKFLVNRQNDYSTGDYKHIHGVSIDRYLKQDTDRLKKTRSYKGIRHALGLSVRGQRTRTTGRGGRAVGVQRSKIKQQQ